MKIAREYITFRNISDSVYEDLQYADIPSRKAHQMMGDALLALVTQEVRDRIEENERKDSLKGVLNREVATEHKRLWPPLKAKKTEEK